MKGWQIVLSLVAATSFLVAGVVPQAAQAKEAVIKFELRRAVLAKNATSKKKIELVPISDNQKGRVYREIKALENAKILKLTNEELRVQYEDKYRYPNDFINAIHRAGNIYINGNAPDVPEEDLTKEQ